MQIVAIIPSRYGSTRFEGKPLALIAGKSMIQRVYEKVQSAKSITQVLVATDDKRIFDFITDFGGNVVMTSSNIRSGTDRVAESAAKIRLKDDDIVVNIQGDQPILDARCIDEMIKPFFTDPDLEMSTLAFKIIDKRERTDPKDVKVTFDDKGYALYFSRSPIPYCRDPSTRFDTYKHLGFYAYKRQFLEIFRRLPTGKLEMIEKLEQLRAIEFGHRIKIVVTRYDSPEVDLPEDIARIEKMINNSIIP